MKIVKEPLSPPHVCAVIPGRGPAKEKEGFIDTGNDIPAIDPHVYVSFAAVREMGRIVGLHTDEDYLSLVAQLTDACERVEVLEGRLEVAHTALDAVGTLQTHFNRDKELVTDG